MRVHPPPPTPSIGYAVTSIGPDGKESTEAFDFVVVASGLNQTCSGLQLGPEGGRASHTCSISSGSKGFEGKTVVVVGLGESASDATSDIANIASKVHECVRVRLRVHLSVRLFHSLSLSLSVFSLSVLSLSV